jgi:sulfate adenylyltransferase
MRDDFTKFGWKKVVGFQTRRPLHRPQFEMIVEAMREARSNLLLLPITGVTRPGDFDHYTRMKCYKKVESYYPPNTFLFNLLPLAMRMSGPRDAILHMIIWKNYGCTHLIIGHNHASLGDDSNNNLFYQYDESTRIGKSVQKVLGVEVVSFEEIVCLPFEDEFRAIANVPSGAKTISFSDSHIQDSIVKGKKVPEWASSFEVIEELHTSYPPPGVKGFTVFFTGLSDAGKPIIAKGLYSRFMEIGKRPVSLLDGDVVRRNLSSELNFSKEHRDINVRRIGYVSTERTKNRGIAICTPIVSYNKTRSQIRKFIEEYRRFFEIHICTPIEEYE